MRPLVSLNNLNKTYRVGEQALHVLDNISLNIQQGDYISIMGPSGSGKSTLLNMIGMLDRPDQGDYQLDGRQTTSLNEEARARLRRQYIGFIFQNFHLVPRLTALENAELPLMLAGVESKRRKQIVIDIFIE